MTAGRHKLDQGKSQIQSNVLSMARKAHTAIEYAMTSLESQDAGIARQVIDEDREVNELLRIIESECLNLLALHQPEASDLREVIGYMQIATEIERVADHAKDISKIVLGMDASDFSGPMEQLAKMSDTALEMLSQLLEALENGDAELATTAASCDDEIDDLDEEACSSLMMQVMTTADPSMRATHLLWIAYHLERIGDRLTNMAERIVFMTTAETPELG